MQPTIYSLVLQSSIYQTPVTHSLCVRYGVNNIHAHLLLPKANEPPGTLRVGD